MVKSINLPIYSGTLGPDVIDVKDVLSNGYSFWPKNTNTEVTVSDHVHNQQLIAQFLPQLATQLPNIDFWQGRAALRAQTTDYLPIVGQLPIYEDFIQDYAELKHGKTIHQVPRYYEGLFVSLGHGSKGFCYAPLAAEVIAAQLNHEPLPIAQRVLQALYPARFWVKALKRQKTTKSVVLDTD